MGKHKLIIDKEKCIGYRMCAKVSPAHNIEIRKVAEMHVLGYLKVNYLRSVYRKNL